MPVNEEEIVVEDSTLVDRFVARSRGAIGASDRMPARVIVDFVIAIACTALAPIPVNIVGVAAVVLLALDTSLHRR
jgi:hypothetical protein